MKFMNSGGCMWGLELGGRCTWGLELSGGWVYVGGRTLTC